MAETNATILIPDISGFTEFITTTELTHSSFAINMLINAIVDAVVGEGYEVSEIEGDAVLLIRKGPAPSAKEVVDTCLGIFNQFHLKRDWMEQYTVCPCGACLAISNLTLKFVVHHGPLAEIKVGQFVKHSGKEMIVAHRLLKNTINNSEYLLMTETLLQQEAASAMPGTMEWFSSSEEYASIGKVPYRFMLLNEARKKAPRAPAPQGYHQTGDTSFLEVSIAANSKDVYMQLMNIPERALWLEGLIKVEQDIPNVFVGSIHHCMFEDDEVVVSPLKMKLSPGRILYSERWSSKQLNTSVVHEFEFKELDDQNCTVTCRCMNALESPLAENLKIIFNTKMKSMAKSLKALCEKVEV